MRLSPRERAAIKDAVRKSDARAKVYLFGSRADDGLRGGDIDLLVVSERISLAEKVLILDRIKSALGEQKIDLVIKAQAELSSDPFAAGIIGAAVLI